MPAVPHNASTHLPHKLMAAGLLSSALEWYDSFSRAPPQRSSSDPRSVPPRSSKQVLLSFATVWRASSPTRSAESSLPFSINAVSYTVMAGILSYGTTVLGLPRNAYC
ncbi:hypothetical protein AB4Z09_10610 [Rhodococcus sp. TAF43]|jgi:hypothetical protein